jgi:hypothetical protein
VITLGCCLLTLPDHERRLRPFIQKITVTFRAQQ